MSNTANENATDTSVSAKAYFVTEIQSMMHGFGDSRTPLVDSACLIESVVQQQMRSIITQAAEVTALRGAKSVGPEDIIFLMRKDRVKLHRMLKYLALKDLKNNMTGILGEAVVDPESVTDTPSSKRSRSYMEFLFSIDLTGELTDTTTLPADIVKYERTVRAERTSRAMDEKKYLEFVNARRTSFVSLKSINKFREWVKMKPDASCEQLKLMNSSYDVLGYLAYETVAQLVDLALLVRQDKQVRAGDPLTRYMPGIGYSARQTMDSPQIETAPAITPAEIREAMRRYWSSPVGSGLSFTRNPNCQFENQFLCS